MSEEQNTDPVVPKATRPARPNRRAERAPTRAPTRAARQTRETTREEVREMPEHTEERLQRRARRNADHFAIDKRMVPTGYTYEWKRETYVGLPDVAHQLELRENGWRPVPSKRHPHMMPPGYDGTGPIKLNGMVLMERPIYLTKEARQEMYDDAVEALGQRQRQATETPQGQLSRNAPSIRDQQRINARYESETLTIPD